MKPKIKFDRTLCGTSYTIYRGIIVTVTKQKGRKWLAVPMVRDNYRFVADDRLTGHQHVDTTKQEAARWSIAGISCRMSIDSKFEVFVCTRESEEEFHQEMQEINQGL